jgi:hypothetical protein
MDRRLEQIGLDLRYATAEQVSVLESLSDTEIELLAQIKQRLDDASGDVQGHDMDGGGVLW